MNSSRLTDILVEFPDNRLLIDLCGEHDRNLANIESRSGVQILRRGNVLAIHGTDEATGEATDVLKQLYSRLEKGRSIENGDIDREFRLKQPTPVKPSEPVEIQTRKKLIEPRTEAQKSYVRALMAHELTFGIGPAGTGKTYLAVAVAVNMLSTGAVDKIILCRPAVEAGERLGFLPGTQEEKVDPYMQPLYDALNDFLPSKQLARMREDKIIEIAPLAFMRGRTLSNAFVVLDEAQNATMMQMKMFLTRLGEGSRMVITGDQSQVDLPRGISSGLADAQSLLGNVEGISFNSFTARDVVRHPLVARIIEAYESASRT